MSTDEISTTQSLGFVPLAHYNRKTIPWRRVSKHAGGWSPQVINDIACRRWKARAHRRALRKENR